MKLLKTMLLVLNGMDMIIKDNNTKDLFVWGK